MFTDTSFESELSELINKHSMENESDTPDFILAEYLRRCLYTFKVAVRARDKWYGFKPWDEGTAESEVTHVAD